ncbi:TLG2-vesicle protein of 38 kDa [Metarhizium guizhouense ARSEF 977]|uniref:Golgi apparatus membrane protein TVP38 n=1 Tax=Metarhizium guizhouense (strain ARSEF 977) TaxID=1276136 RepID=A0A0B4HG19_METGA|nr:TLG2-vesicle protein of 38 kDa [Metarhizium guizhouense ARSEF 977]
MASGYSAANQPRRTSPPSSSPSPPPPPSSSSSPSPSPPSNSSSARASPEPVRWSRRSFSPSRRLSNAMLRARSSSAPRTLLQRVWRKYLDWSRWLIQYYLSLSPLYRVLAVLGCLLGWALIVLTIVYSHRFFSWLTPVAKSWRELPGGWLIVFALIFVTAFPPLIGYSTANTIAGLVYGFPNGWPVAAVACTLGSLGAFLASRTVLSRYVDRMVGKDHRFIALGQVLRRDGILYLTAIRFCPLPFSLSNGFLATIPSITPLSFAISTALSTQVSPLLVSPPVPKLLIHVFIGSRLAILAEEGDKMTAGDKAVNYIGMAVGGIIGLAVGLAIYRRTMARAAELALEEGQDIGHVEQGSGRYDDTDDTDDTDATLLDPEDAAAIMSGDHVSLWGAQENAWGTFDDDDGSSSRKPNK